MCRAENYDQQTRNDVRFAAVIGEEHPLWQKLRPEDPDNKKDLRRTRYYPRRILLNRGF